MAAEAVGGAFLSSFLGVLFDRLSSPEVLNLIQGKKLDQKLLGRFKTTLYAAQAVLNDAEKKQITDSVVKEWLDELKDAVYKADDLLDELSTKAATQKDHPTGNIFTRLFNLNLEDKEMVNRMEDILDTIESIVKHKDILGLREIPMENMSLRIPSTSLVKMSDIYGREEDKEAIVKLLLDDTSGGELSVIPIVGMGGIGKTTLAQLVFNDNKVKTNFDFQVWVCVGDEFNIINVTRTIIQAIARDSCDTNDLNLLQQDLKEKLSGKKFLVVLDDMWIDNYDDLIIFLRPLYSGSEESKVLITTRNDVVASVVKTVPTYKLSLLSDEYCWQVFAKHALLSTESQDYSTKEKIGRKIVEKCKGLPLAAQTLGGLLRTKDNVRDWSDILKSEIWELSESEIRILPALRISYHYLPSQLKRCFVYCSLYPKDYEFDRDELVLLWMAEDLLMPRKSRSTLEEIGYKYFDDLTSRSFFQPSKYTVKNSFVMHDLMHDLAIFYAGKFYFRASELGSAANVHTKTRHLSCDFRDEYLVSKFGEACESLKHARTLLNISLYQFPAKIACCFSISNVKCLRVLSLKSFPLDSVPDSIGELIHLRYLNLSQTYIVTLPESLGNLYNLQTLKLMGCRRLEMLPSGTHTLVNMRYLDIRGTSLKEMPKGMNNLKDLQLLTDYIVGKNEENGIRELGALVSLHGSLSIDKLENVIDSGEASKAKMDEKKHIDILELKWSSQEDIDDSHFERDILNNLQPHIELKVLSIEGYRGTIFPNWLGYSSYHNMTELTLSKCRNCCMLPSLGHLPYLKQLEISGFDGLERIDVGFYKNDNASCLETPFPSLETLKFDLMPSWQEWHSFEIGAFPKLRNLEIYDCPMLRGNVPNHLPALKQLSIIGCKQLACPVPSAILDLVIVVSCSKCISCGSLDTLLYYSNTYSLSEPRHFCRTCRRSWTKLPKIKILQPLILQTKTTKFNSSSSSSSSSSRAVLWIDVGCEIVKSLPHCLTRLTIKGVSEGLVKSFPNEGWLPASLEYLSLEVFISLKTLDGSGLVHLTSLRHLRIDRCFVMETIVGEILPASLVQLDISRCPLAFRCQERDQQIWPKISHIPTIRVTGSIVEH